MRKLIILGILLITATMAVAQNSGLGFNYQAVVRRSDGLLLANSEVTLRVSLYPGQNAVTPTWMELHKVNTDNSGSFGITVGKGQRSGNSLVSAFKDVSFSGVHYWMKIELYLGGDNYRELSFSQLPSTPYSEATYGGGTFVGMIAPFAGPADKIPAGWLLCDGRAVSRTQYQSLFDAIGVSWGKGNGSSTFNVPDLRGMFLRGVSGDSSRDEDAESRMAVSEGGNTGNKVGSYQEDAIRNITGQIGFMDIYRLTNPNTNGAFYAIEGTNNGPHVETDKDNGLIKFDASRAPGVSVGSDNRPKNVYVTYIIKY